MATRSATPEKVLRLLETSDSYVILLNCNSRLKTLLKGDYKMLIDKLWSSSSDSLTTRTRR